MNDNSTKAPVRQVGPVTAAIRAMRAEEPSPWISDGSDREEWRVASFAAQRAIAEGFNDRSELIEVSTAAYRGPFELARRMRETEFGASGTTKRQSLASYFAHLFGEECPPDGAYAESYTYALQAIYPFIRSVH